MFILFTDFKTACIQTGRILAPADSQARANHIIKFARIRAKLFYTHIFQQQFLLGTVSRLA